MVWSCCRMFDMEEKAYVLEGSATLTADDPAKHGDPVTIGPKDMVTFPKGWKGAWKVRWKGWTKSAFTQYFCRCTPS